MSSLSGLAAAATVMCAVGGLLFGLRKLVRKQAAKTRAVLDQSDYVVLEALPEQLPELQRAFERKGWPLSETRPSDARASLFTFRKASAGSAPLSELILGNGRPPASTGTSFFPIKIKAHGTEKAV